MNASFALLALALAVLAATATAKVYTRCELATELKTKHGFTRSELPDWLCLVEAESRYNTAARNVNGPPRYTVDYGLFQINDRYWCGPTGKNVCKISCSVLTDNNIADDVKCARRVKADSHGFKAWYGWRNKCMGKDLSKYLKGCNV